MKAIHIIGHPISNIILFMLVLISGEAWGGFYIVYLLVALPHGSIHSLLGIGGLLCLYLSYKIYRKEKKHWVRPALHLAGILLAVLSLYVFFIRDTSKYNYATFEQSVPLLSLLLFGISILCGVVSAVVRLLHAGTDRDVSSNNSLGKA
jgi:hypothetical protein